MQQQLEMSEVYESLNDALSSAVKALGGFKKVGPMLRPELSIDGSSQWLRDCLNTDRRECLHPEQVLLLMREARRAGWHALMEFVAFDAGYAATPVTPDSQESELQRRFLNAVEGLTAIQAQLQRINRLRTAA